jgi:DNA gyrase/topoisomerase IV subunit B
VNPSFDTQTKDALTTPSSKFGSKCELSDKFMTALYKTGLIDKAISLTEFHQEKKVAKTDGKKQIVLSYPNLMMQIGQEQKIAKNARLFLRKEIQQRLWLLQV